MPSHCGRALHDSVYVIVRDTVLFKRVGPQLQAISPALHGPRWETAVTLVGLILVPLLAAWLGAKEGGRQARKAAAEEFKRQTSDLEERERKLVKRRVVRDVEHVGQIHQALTTLGPLRMAPAVVDMLLQPWQEYRSWRDATLLLREPEFEDRLTKFYDAIYPLHGLLHTASSEVIRQMEHSGAVNSEWTDKAARALDRLKGVVEMGRGLLKDLDRQ